MTSKCKGGVNVTLADSRTSIASATVILSEGAAHLAGLREHAGGNEARGSVGLLVGGGQHARLRHDLAAGVVDIVHQVLQQGRQLGGLRRRLALQRHQSVHLA
eukprot:924230-Prorocentrum_minimum.AAC.3